MSKAPLGPERKHQLEAYIKCLKRAERRIIIAGKRSMGIKIDISNFFVQRPLIIHIQSLLSDPRRDGFTTALMALRIKRSRFQAELEGREWSA